MALIILFSAFTPIINTKALANTYTYAYINESGKLLNSDRYKELRDRMVNILPDGSMIGVILNHYKYNFIKSKGVSIEKHYPVNWNIFGEFFVEAEENKSSKALHDRIKLGLSNISSSFLTELSF